VHLQNSQNCTLRFVGGAQREVVQPYVIFSPNVSVLSAGAPKKERVVWFYRIERMVARSLCNGFFKTYALIPC
jgi:hypothetical protein